MIEIIGLVAVLAVAGTLLRLQKRMWARREVLTTPYLLLVTAAGALTYAGTLLAGLGGLVGAALGVSAMAALVVARTDTWGRKWLPLDATATFLAASFILAVAGTVVSGEWLPGAVYAGLSVGVFLWWLGIPLLQRDAEGKRVLGWRPMSPFTFQDTALIATGFLLAVPATTAVEGGRDGAFVNIIGSFCVALVLFFVSTVVAVGIGRYRYGVRAHAKASAVLAVSDPLAVMNNAVPKGESLNSFPAGLPIMASAFAAQLVPILFG